MVLVFCPVATGAVCVEAGSEAEDFGVDAGLGAGCVVDFFSGAIVIPHY